MQNAAIEAIGLAGEWSYEAIDVAPDAFERRLGEMPGEGFVGANITVPHKEAALALSDRASTDSREIGAANVLSFEPGGVAAANTDAPGFLAALPRSPTGTRALVLGAGGAARAVVWALERSGARVHIWNRTAERAAALAAEFGVASVAAEGGLPAAEFELLVNTTTVGMAGGGLEDLHLTPDSFGSTQVVVDLVYGGAETELIAASRAGGAATVDGLEVLVRQGFESLRIWTGKDPPLRVMREAARGA